MLLEGANHLESGPVSHVREARVFVASEVALQNAPVGRAVEEGAPLFELLDAVGGFHGVKLRHSPLVEIPAALHRVAEVDLPVVLRLDVAERRRHAALGHDRVGLAEQRLAHETYAGPLGARLNRGSQSGAPGADDEHVVLMRFELGSLRQHHPKTSRGTWTGEFARFASMIGTSKGGRTRLSRAL